MKAILRSLLPPTLALVIFCSIFCLPKNAPIQESCISPGMPVGLELPGWHGVKTQESELERIILAADTRFSKARYTPLKRVPWEKQAPPVNVSIVYSGRDLNNSIHRPERCLPSQGHIDVRGESDTITLADGRTIKLTRLVSKTIFPGEKKQRLNHIHYYLFIGQDSVCHTHVERTIRDIADRCLLGKIQSWAYFQAGTYWAPELDISEEEADSRLRKLISELLPRQIDWKKVK